MGNYCANLLVAHTLGFSVTEPIQWTTGLDPMTHRVLCVCASAWPATGARRRIESQISVATFFLKEQEGQAGPTGIYLNKVKKQQSKSTKHGEVAGKKHSKELRKGR